MLLAQDNQRDMLRWAITKISHTRMRLINNQHKGWLKNSTRLLLVRSLKMCKNSKFSLQLVNYLMFNTHNRMNKGLILNNNS